MVQTKCRLNNTELLTIFRAMKLETTSTTKKQQNLKNSKVRFRLNIDVRKEMEDPSTGNTQSCRVGRE